MKKQILILVMVMVASLSMKAQYGGVINAINNSGVLGQIRRNVSALMTSDSIAALKIDSVKAHLPISNGKLSIDSISIKSMPTFSVSATNPSVSSTGSAIPASATMVGGSDGTNLKAFQTNSSGHIRVDSAYLRKVVSVDNFPSTYPVTGTFWQATQPVSLASVPSHNVTNAGTFATQVTSLPALATGTNAIGSITNTSFGISGTLPGFASTPTVNIGTTGTIPVSGTFWQATQPVSGTVTTTPPSNASTNISQINGVTPLMGNGVTGTGSPRVTIASDNTPFTVNSAQSGSWNINNITSVTSVTSLPLPAGASTEATLNDIKTNQTNGSQSTSIYDVSTGGVATVINNAGTNPLSVQQTNSSGVPINLAEVSSEGSGIGLGGYLAYGADRTTGGSHAISVKQDGDLLDGEYGMPLVAWNNSNTQYNFLRVDGGNNLMVSDPYTYTMSQQQINGTQKSIVRGGAKGTTAAADVTSTATGANHQAVDVAIMDASGNQITSFGGGTQYAELSTTAPATGTVALGRYQTTPPTLTNGQLNAPMLDASGNMKVNVVSGGGGGTQYSETTTTSPATGTSALFRYNSTDPTLTNGQMSMPLLTAKGEVRTLSKGQLVSGTITTQNLVPAGVATAGSAVEVDMTGCSSVYIQVTGTYTGVLTPQGTLNGTTWITLQANPGLLENRNTSGVANTIPSGTQMMYFARTQGMTKFRLTALAAVTGTATITLQASPEAGSTAIINSSVGVQVTGVQTGGTTSPWHLEDAASVNGEILEKIAVLRNDALTNNTSASGDWQAPAGTKYGALYVKDEEKQKVSYTVCSQGITLAASATDVFTITPAAASKQLNITRITLTGTATSGTTADVQLIRRSTANSAGIAETFVPLDPADPAVSSRAYSYTTNPTLGTLVNGYIKAFPMYFSPANVQTVVYDYKFGQDMKPIILRASTNDSFCINLSNTTVTGGRLTVMIECTEEGIGVIFLILGFLYMLGLLKIKYIKDEKDINYFVCTDFWN